MVKKKKGPNKSKAVYHSTFKVPTDTSFKINKKSLLGRWYLWNQGDVDWDVDICKFRRVCFITGPLFHLIMAFFASLLGWFAFVYPWVFLGWWKAIFVYLGIIISAAIIASIGLGVAWIIEKGQTSNIISESYRSWKDKYCKKVKFV